MLKQLETDHEVQKTNIHPLKTVSRSPAHHYGEKERLFYLKPIKQIVRVMTVSLFLFCS